MWNKITGLPGNLYKTLLITVVAVLVGMILGPVPEWQVHAGGTDPNRRVEVANDLRKTYAQILAGLVILIGVYYTARRVAAAERTAEAALKNVEVAQESQITERFTQAITQLGDTNTAVCLGGIYALERIAKDSFKDHWQVMEVLTAYVRENARWQEGDQTVAEEEVYYRLPITVQAILTVLGRRNREHENQEQRLDLRSSDLRHALLHEARLEGADLRNAHLEGATLYRAHLEAANLHNAHLEGANLWQASLEGATLLGAQLEGADLRSAHLEANLIKAQLQRAILWGVQLHGANLSGANLEGTDLRGVDGLTQEQLDAAASYQNAILPNYLQQPAIAKPDRD